MVVLVVLVVLVVVVVVVVVVVLVVLVVEMGGVAGGVVAVVLVVVVAGEKIVETVVFAFLTVIMSSRHLSLITLNCVRSKLNLLLHHLSPTLIILHSPCLCPPFYT